MLRHIRSVKKSAKSAMKLVQIAKPELTVEPIRLPKMVRQPRTSAKHGKVSRYMNTVPTSNKTSLNSSRRPNHSITSKNCTITWTALCKFLVISSLWSSKPRFPEKLQKEKRQRRKKWVVRLLLKFKFSASMTTNAASNLIIVTRSLNTTCLKRKT